MKRTRYTAVVDPMGRVTLPTQLRKNFKINSGEELEVCTQGIAICFRKLSAPDAIIEQCEDILDAVEIDRRFNTETKRCVKDNIKVVIAALKEHKREGGRRR